MKSLLHTLNDNEAVLLMYLFDELPADDRVEVEGMLLTDSTLRAELQHLEVVHATVTDAIKLSDGRLSSPRSEAAARRNTYKLVDQWNTRRLLRQAAVVRRAPSKLKWALYASGAAAAALVAVTYFWVMSNGDQYNNFPSIATTGVVPPEVEDRLANSFDDPDSPEINHEIADARSIDSSDLLRKSLDTSEEMLSDSLTHVDLAAAEREIKAIAILSDLRTINGDADGQDQFQ